MAAISNNDDCTFKEVRCPACKKLLFKVCGLGCVVEILCKCGQMVRWPVLVAELRPDKR